VSYSISEACERNKGPILELLAGAFAHSRAVLEIGSGTGQHAVHFATHLPHLTWHPSDRQEYLPGLQERIAHDGPKNLRTAIELDVRRLPWDVTSVDAVFTANTLHIMGWDAVEDFFFGVGSVVGAAGLLCIYGPFRYRGGYTSESNARFDEYLQARDPLSGIRDFEAVDRLAVAQNLRLLADHAMPANNQLLVWEKPATPSG
jgi:hypothetical protein